MALTLNYTPIKNCYGNSDFKCINSTILIKNFQISYQNIQMHEHGQTTDSEKKIQKVQTLPEEAKGLATSVETATVSAVAHSSKSDTRRRRRSSTTSTSSNNSSSTSDSSSDDDSSSESLNSTASYTNNNLSERSYSKQKALRGGHANKKASRLPDTRDKSNSPLPLPQKTDGQDEKSIASANETSGIVESERLLTNANEDDSDSSGGSVESRPTSPVVKVPLDPHAWNTDDIAKWVKWLTKQFKIDPEPDIARFPTVGVELCELSRADFWVCAGSRQGGIILAKHFALTLYNATGRKTSPMLNEDEPSEYMRDIYTYIMHIIYPFVYTFIIIWV